MKMLKEQLRESHNSHLLNVSEHLIILANQIVLYESTFNGQFCYDI